MRVGWCCFQIWYGRSSVVVVFRLGPQSDGNSLRILSNERARSKSIRQPKPPVFLSERQRNASTWSHLKSGS